MTKAIAVIGAMFGDEGKGLMTDYFAHKHPNSIVIRSNGGANAGHCQTGDTLIVANDGLRYIEDMVGSVTNNDHCFTLINMNGELEQTSLLFTEHEKWVNRITLRNGVVLNGTDAHAYFVWNGETMKREWVTTTQLNPTIHQFIIPKRFNSYVGTTPTIRAITSATDHIHNKVKLDPTKINPTFMAFLLGLINGDGYFSTDGKNRISIQFHVDQTDVCHYTSNMLCRMGITPHTKQHESSPNCLTLSFGGADLIAVMVQLGVTQTKGADKQTPTFVLQGTRDIMVEYIKGLMDSDGTVKFHKSRNKTSGQLGFSSISQRLVTELQQLLYMFGIHSKILPNKVRECCQPSWTLMIASVESIALYNDNIGFRGGIKQRKCTELYHHKHNTPSPQTGMGYRVKINSVAKRNIATSIGVRYHKSNTTTAGFIQHHHNDIIGHEELIQVCLNFHIIDISDIQTHHKLAQVYDVTMPQTHSYIANGVISHNTVETPEGERHVFSHFGSGSFVNTATYLSEFFVCNPMLYLKEKTILHAMGVFPTLVVHPNALISTPFDMIVNMILEARRGADRHGSCGVGFGETIARSITHKRLTMRDLYSLTREGLRDRLYDIRSTYITNRFKDQPLDRNTNSDASWMMVLQNDNLIEDWLDTAAEFTSDVTISGYEILTHDTVIFEGAQGLMLDQQSPDFPHVTRSNTGVKNMMEILRSMNRVVPDFKLEDFEVVYVSRAYTTRHGAGPLDFEQELPYDITDTTNRPNANQGEMRFAPLLLDILSSVTLHDFDQLSNSDNSVNRAEIDHDLLFDARVSMAFTCLDQIGDTGLFVAGNALTSSACEDFVGLLVESAVYTSYGPTRDDILENRR